MRKKKRMSRKQQMLKNKKKIKIKIVIAIIIVCTFSFSLIKGAFNSFLFKTVSVALNGGDVTEQNDLADDGFDYDNESEYYIEKDNIFTQSFSLFNKGEKDVAPKEKPQNALPIKEKFYEYKAGGAMVQNRGNGFIKNCTDLTTQDVLDTINQDSQVKIQLNSKEPQVLIMHTHTTESFEKFDLGYYDPSASIRSMDESMTVVAVGSSIKSELLKEGINTIQDKTVHDNPQYNGAYNRSRAVVEDYLKKYPSIKVVLDVHRDAIQVKDGTRYKPTTIIDGKKAAQIMLICGANGNGANIPNYKENLKFASKFQNYMESEYKGLTRPVLFDYRFYNQDLTNASLLVEVGGHANTISEAIYSGQLVGKSLAKMLKTMV